MRFVLRGGVFGSVAIVAAMGASGCGSSSARSGFERSDAPDAGASSQEQPAPGTTGDLGQQQTSPPEDAQQPAEVFGHSATTLYRLDPVTKAVTVVSDFKGCGQVIDIALDEKSNLIGVSNIALYEIDKKTAVCTQVGGGQYPNSLSFVPKGTLDPAAEALVGYVGADYYRIDTKSGARMKVGAIGGSLISSGDIVSVKGGQTYLTVKGGECEPNDCLIEVDPATGKMVRNWGTIGHQNVFGLSFWAGKVYGFDDNGEMFEVTFDTSSVSTKAIPIPNKPAGLSFWGAGSTTSAPLVPQPQ